MPLNEGAVSVQRAVRKGTQKWKEVRAERGAIGAAGGAGPPLSPQGSSRPSLLGTFLRLWIWLGALLRFLFVGYVFDYVELAHRIQRRRNLPPERQPPPAPDRPTRRRARRLRETLESLGPTFIKIGQQLSLRADLFGEDYCEELQGLQDNVKEMPPREAEETIKLRLGAPPQELFMEFQPKPIGSASLSCVYKARLHNGSWVALKVLRRGVARRMKSELRALRWLLTIVELLGILRRGMATGIHEELDTMLMEELDFRREARNTELFRLGIENDQQKGFSAPKVYWKLLSDETIGFEFIEGKKVQEIIDAVESQDLVALAELRDMKINHRKVARRLTRALHWELNESILFHGDPHPANMIVRPGGEPVFVDFGSCGKMTGKFKRTWRKFYLDYANNDVGAMVENVLQLLEPLPHIDLPKFSRDIEAALWDYVHAGRSPHSKWWERASGRLWMRFASIARRHSVPMSTDTVRLFRATFLYDTVIFRLWGTTRGPDPGDWYRVYWRDAGLRARRRVLNAAIQRLKGPMPEDYLRVERAWELGRQALATFQHLLDLPQAVFRNLMSKLAYAAALVLRSAAIATVVGLLVFVPRQVLKGYRGIELMETLRALANNPVVFTTAVTAGLLCLFILLRKLIQRVGDPDSHV